MNWKCFTTSVLLLFLSSELFAKPALVVLEYRDKGAAAGETEKFTDRLREEFHRRLHGAVLTRAETSDLLGYHKRAAIRPSRGPALGLLEDAKKAYFELNLPQALQSLDRITGLPREDSADVIIESYLLKGLTLMAQGDELDARAAFQETLRLNPKAKLDPQFFPPKVVKLYSEVVRSNSSPKGSLEVTASPEGAEVRVNGILKGLAPLTLKEMPTGRHVVAIGASHYQSAIRQVDIKEGNKTLVSTRLSWEKTNAGPRFLGLSDADIGKAERLPTVGANLGTLLGVQKVLFVNYHSRGGEGFVTTRLVDVNLRTAHKEQIFPAENVRETSAETADQVADHLMTQMGEIVQEKPDRYAQNRFEGDIVLIGHHHKPFYKRPLFWILVGAAGAGGGITAALAGGGAAVGAIGVLFP